MRSYRAGAAVAFALTGAVLLAGCQSPPEVEDAAPGCAPEGAAARSVSAEGELFSRPEVQFDAPVSPVTTERSVLVEGDGATVVLGATVTVDFVAFNGATGDPLEVTGYGAPGVGHTVLTLDGESAMPGLRRALLCSTVGSRVAAVVHPDDGMAESGLALGLGLSDPIVYVFDIVAVALDRANGEPQTQEGSLPVVEEVDGAPVVAIPAAPPPTELISSTLLLGSGPTVRSGSDVYLRYRAVLWRNGLSVEENWSVAQPTRFAMSELLPGVAQSLVGQPTGSRLLVIVPPAYGYGADGDVSSSVTGTDTLVYVVDILATT
ncbi:FKBP-type peptidyl-prolyl cis-trans isomerase [Salinibacterium sp. SYSU T00001]|uniref:FKBP-type peptidyl-prolyl cis-trans isomerase n=1 Tax=Homoserinimonas sedimenticola TaxID=2986805 RepID=UPI002235F80C|nr:FKBP-type peptidyl-prolyl cis-trans isomerase [Salinibacterium sedimenticola]MCW4386695.1 FKBP-type peptidyl-prolyl cis-trans isomerase [Salinibacterium sedimenticola]